MTSENQKIPLTLGDIYRTLKEHDTEILKRFNEVEISENTIRVTIPFNFPTTPKIDMGDKVRDKVGVKLNDTQRKMLELLRDNPNLTQPQLMIALGLGETAVQNNISFLRNHEFIRRIGSKKTGYWEVIADEE